MTTSCPSWPPTSPFWVHLRQFSDLVPTRHLHTCLEPASSHRSGQLGHEQAARILSQSATIPKKARRPFFGASFERWEGVRNREVRVPIESLSYKSPWTPLLASQVLMAVELKLAKVGAFCRNLRQAPGNLPSVTVGTTEKTAPHGEVEFWCCDSIEQVFSPPLFVVYLPDGCLF